MGQSMRGHWNALSGAGAGAGLGNTCTFSASSRGRRSLRGAGLPVSPIALPPGAGSSAALRCQGAAAETTSCCWQVSLESWVAKAGLGARLDALCPFPSWTYPGGSPGSEVPAGTPPSLGKGGAARVPGRGRRPARRAGPPEPASAPAYRTALGASRGAAWCGSATRGSGWWRGRSPHQVRRPGCLPLLFVFVAFPGIFVLYEMCCYKQYAAGVPPSR